MSLHSNKIFSLSFALVIYLLSTNFAFAQTDIQSLRGDSIDQLKLDGKLNGSEQFSNSRARIPQIQSSSINSAPPPLSCDCWVPRDASWLIAALDGTGASGGPGLPPDYRNDDWSTLPIPLPFNFCFYGTSVNSIYINNNGNVSVGGAYSTFTATGFPNNTFVMIAPFWADVDTRGPLSGLVYYKLTPTYMIVQWENVGYFSQQDDKLNTFQLIITDGIDPILPAGQNTAFCYKDMAWTTGSASGGTNGFGGTPATVGVNRGNGIDYIQVGTFDTSGTAYDGPFGADDGIDALDNQTFVFNSCVSSSNIAPLVTAIQVCDTHKVCINDTIFIHAEYLSPEQGQVTVANVNPNGMTGVSVISSTTGITASIDVQIVGLSTNIGYHTIYITGTDNGAPPLTNSTPVIIQVMPAPTTSFTYSPASPVSPGTVITFTSTSVGAFAYLWDFGDGTTSVLRDPTHTYFTPGTYTVTLKTTGPNGCSSTQSQQVIITVCASATFNVIDTLCLGTTATVTFSGVASAGAVFDWNFGSGSILTGSGRGPYTIVWNTAGNQTVSLTVNDAPCGPISTSQPVNVVPIPIASILTTTSLCVGDQNTLAFNGTAQSNATFVWNVGSGTVVSGTGTSSDPFTILWNTAGATTVGVIVDQNGCADTAQENIQVSPNPTSTFNMVPSVCAGIPVQINYTGSAPSSATFTWNFGGGTIISGSGQGPYNISWPNAGTPSVTLSVLDNGCPSVLTSIPITVNAIPLASFSTNQFTCPDDINTVTFTGSPASGATYNWDFGSASVVSGSGPGPYELSWNNSGSAGISLVVISNGCSDTSTFNVTVYPIPVSTFTLPASMCPGDTVQITYTGNADPGATFDWNFNAANIISGSGSGPYQATWTNGGNANVSLIVTENGCPSLSSQNSIIIETLPAADAGSDITVCSGTTLTIGTVNSPGLIYSWSPTTDLTDPNSGVTTLNGINNGSFTDIRKYILNVSSNIGCLNNDTVLVTIDPIPSVAFTSQAAQCLNDNKFQFYVSGTRIPGAQYLWTFGPDADPTQSNLEIPLPVHFETIGQHPVTLNASYGNCIGAPFSDNITIVADPEANFQPLIYEGCVPLTVPFVNQSIGGNTYLWTFSDSQTDTATAAMHVFTNAGTYSVDLLTRNVYGCTDFVSYPDLIKVHPKPESSFSPSPDRANILEPMIQFINSTPGINQYYWEFGDGDSSTNINPDHFYKEIGTYTVTLYVTNLYGCKDSITALVRIEDDFTFYIPNAFSPNGDGRNDFFGGFGTRLKAYHMDVLDRWGLVIYSSDDMGKPWDGSVKNGVQSDVYLYKIQVTDNNDHTHVYTGHVTVIR